MDANGKLVVWGPVVWDSRVLQSNNPFHTGIPNIQNTNPNHQFTISWNMERKKLRHENDLDLNFHPGSQRPQKT